MLDEQDVSVLERPVDAEWVASSLLTATRAYERARIVFDSELGRRAISDARIKTYAARQLADARQLANWTRIAIAEDADATTAMVLMAQALFVASHGGYTSSIEIFPSQADLRTLLMDSRAGGLLSGTPAALPSWLRDVSR